MPLSSFASWSEFQREQAREQMADDAPHVRPPNRFYRKFTQASMENIIEKLHPEEFKRSYGVNIDTYREILETIGDDIRIESQGHGGVRNSEVIEPAIKLAVTLRWLRGGSYIDLWERYGISRSTFQRATHEVMHAINRHYTMPFAGRLRRYLSGEATDEDVEALSTIAQGFAQHTGGIIDRCLGAIDGVLVRIKKMSRSQCGNPTSYMTRKGFFAVNVQAIADADGAILWFSVRCPGSVHDSAAFSLTQLHDLIEAMERVGVHFVGDDAYKNGEAMLCPYRFADAPAGSDRDAYNYYQSLTRQPIERAFGMVERRWGILWRRLEVRTLTLHPHRLTH